MIAPLTARCIHLKGGSTCTVGPSVETSKLAPPKAAELSATHRLLSVRAVQHVACRPVEVCYHPMRTPCATAQAANE